MKTKTFLLGIISLLISSVVFSQEKTETYPLDLMIQVINNSLDKANKRLDSVHIQIQHAEITLQTLLDKSGGGGFKIFVKAEKKWELEKASTLTFTFEKIESRPEPNYKSLNKDIFEKNLIEAIVDAAHQWKNTTNIVNGLSKKNFNVEISFSVKKDTSIGVEFEIWGCLLYTSDAADE